VLLLLACVGAYASTFLPQQDNRQLTYVLLDRSETMDPVDQCGAMVEIMTEALHYGGPLQLRLFGTGDNTNGRHVVPIGKPQELEAINILEKDENDHARADAIAALQAACAKTKRTNVTPLVMSIEDIIAQMRHEGCNQPTGPTCTLYIRSDGREEYDQGVMKSLKGTSLDDVEASIDNERIDVTFIDLGSTLGSTSIPLQTVDDAYRPLFTKQKRVSFLPSH
jgi:hypothetical protein